MQLYSYTGLFSATVSNRQFADGEAESPKKNFWQKHKGKILGAAALAGLGGLGYVYRNELGQAWNSAVGKANEVKNGVQKLSAASAAIQEWDGMVNALSSQNNDEAFLAALSKGQGVASFGNNLTGHQVGLCKNIIKKLEAAYQRLVDSKGKIGGWWMAMNHESDLKALSLKFDQIAGERRAWEGGHAS